MSPLGLLIEFGWRASVVLVVVALLVAAALWRPIP